MGVRPGRVFVHVGLPKTGSSAIQAFLTLNSETLKSKGVFFPNPPNLDHPYQTTTGNAYQLSKHLIKGDQHAANQYFASLEASGHTIISSENLFNALRKYPDQFFAAFEPYNYSVIAYIRRPDSWIESCYKQRVKNHGWKQRFNLQYWLRYSDFYSVLKECVDRLGLARVIVRCYERDRLFGGSIYNDFLRCVGVEMSSDFVFPNRIVNPSLSGEALEFRRILNILEIDERDNCLRHKINDGLVKYTVHKRGGRPFQNGSLLSLQERIQILNYYSEKNREIGRMFFDREDFFSSLSSIETNLCETCRLSAESLSDICTFIREEEGGLTIDLISKIEAAVEGYLQSTVEKGA